MTWWRRRGWVCFDGRRAGWLALVFMLGVGAGNFHRTETALKGQGRWFQDWCGQQVKTKLIQHERDNGELP